MQGSLRTSVALRNDVKSSLLLFIFLIGNNRGIY